MTASSAKDTTDIGTSLVAAFIDDPSASSEGEGDGYGAEDGATERTPNPSKVIELMAPVTTTRE